MKSEEIKQITNKATDQLIAALKEGRSETLTSYLAAIGRFHRYSLRNVMLIASQKPAATHVAGFHTWKKLGRFVKKGEKGIFILAPIIRRKTKDSEQNHTDESSMPAGFRLAYVFDISQTEGEELPEFSSVRGDPREFRDRLALLRHEARHCPRVFIRHRAGSRNFRRWQDHAAARSPAEEFATLAHELAHEMMHRTERRSITSKCVRETEAEAVAYVVSHAIGLDTGSAAQDYIQLYDGDAKLLTESLEYIQQTASAILQGIGAEGESSPPL